MKTALVILFIAFASQAHASSVCTVKNGHKLTPFNGKAAKLDFPCKYNLARYQCGDWNVRITPGQDYLVPHYHICTVWVGLSKVDGTVDWKGRTTNKIATKFLNGDQHFPFNKVDGPPTGDVLSCTGTSNTATCTTLDGQVRITFGPFIPDTAGLDEKFEFECLAAHDPPPFPEHFCGGDDVTEARQKAVELGFAASVADADQEARDKTYYYYAFTDATTNQSPEPVCAAVVDVMNNNCANDSVRADVIEKCYRILYSRPHRQCITKYSCKIIDAFLACAKFVCSGCTDEEACQELGDYIDQCRNFPGLSDKVAECYRGKFIEKEV